MGSEQDRRIRRAPRVDIAETRPLAKVPGYRRGEVLTAEKLTGLARGVARNAAPAFPQQLRGRRTAGFYEARVVQEFDDYVSAEIFGAGDPETIIVSKPYLLRRNPHEHFGRTVVSYEYQGPSQRKASTPVLYWDQSFVEDVQTLGAGGSVVIRWALIRYERTSVQHITPGYEPGDVLLVTNMVQSIAQLNADSDGTLDAFLDCNADGRCWARVGEEKIENPRPVDIVDDYHPYEPTNVPPYSLGKFDDLTTGANWGGPPTTNLDDEVQPPAINF